MMKNIENNIWIIAAVTGCTGVILGAFGAHGLKNLVDTYALEIWQKAVDYQFYHALALLLLASTSAKSKFLNFAALCFVIGIVFFSGSLYVLALKDFLRLSSISWIGPITPIGGLFLIAGWMFLLVHGVKFSKVNA